MLSKNNYKEKLRKMEPRKERFSIRKFSIGAASVLIGFFFMGIESQNVHADTLAPSQNKEVNKVKTPTVQNEKINLGKNTEVTLNNGKTSDITSEKNITSNDTNVQNNRERVADNNAVSLQKEKASDVTTGKNVTSNASNAQSSTDKTTNNQIALKQKKVTPSVTPSVNTTNNKSNVLSNQNTPQINNQVSTSNKQILATSNVAQVSNFADFTSALINKDINEIDFTNDISSSTGQSALNTSLLSGELSANSSNPFNSTYKDIARTLTINGQNHTLDLGNNYIAFYNQNVNSSFWNLTLKNMTLKANDNAGYSPFYFQNMGTNQQKNSSITFDNVNANLSKTQLFYGEDTPVILAGNTTIKDDLGKTGLGSLGAGYYNGIVCRSLTVTPDANVTMTVNTPDYAMNLWKPTPGAYVEENNNAVWLNSDDGNITIGKNAKFTINSITQDMRGLASRAAGSTMKVEDGAQVVMNLANGHSTAIFAGNLDVGKNASIDITTMQDNNSEAASLPIAGATVVNSPLNWTNGVLNANGYHYAPISIGSFTFLQPLTHETHAINMEQGSTIRIYRGKANTITPLISFGSGSSNSNKTYTMTVGKGATLDLQDGAYGTVRAYTSYTMGLANSFPHAVEGPLNSQPASFYPCGLITMFGVNGVNSLTFNSPKYVNLQRTDTTKTGSLIRLEGGTNEVNVNGSSIDSIPTSAYDVKQTMLGKDSQTWQISNLTTYNGIGNTGLAFMPAGKKQNSVLSTNAETYTMGMSNGKVLMSPTQSGLNTYQYNNGVIDQGAPTQTGGNYVQSKDNLKSFLDNFNWWTPAQISFTSFDLDNSKYTPQTKGIEVTYYSTKPNVVRSTKPITFLNAEGQEVTNVPLLSTANGQAFTLQTSSSSSIATYALDTQANDEIPEGTTINSQTGAISFIPTADEVGKTFNVPVLVRYADFSQMPVIIPVKVIAATDAQQYPAVGQDITTPAGIVPPAEKGIKNTAELPEGTKYSWKNIPVVPDKSGQTVKATVVVTYPDNSTNEVPVTITTTEEQKETDADKYAPVAQPITTPAGVMPNPEEGIKNTAELPEGTKYSWENKPVIPNESGKTINSTVVVTYPDGSQDKVDVPITTTENEAEKFDNNNKDNALISGLTVTQGQKVVPSDALKAIKDPDANNVKSATFKETVNTDIVGEKNYPATVTFNDGSTTTVNIPVTVKPGESEAEKFNEANKDNALVQGITVKKGANVFPAEAIDGIKEAEKNHVKEAVFNEKVDTTTVGIKDYAVTVTFDDNSTTTVEMPVTVAEETDADKFNENNKDNVLIKGLVVTQGEKVTASDALKAIKDPDANNIKGATFNENVNTNNIGRQFYPATVTFNDGSTTIVNIPVTVQAATTDADKYKPESQPIDVPVGGELPDPSTGIKNKDEMPSGTKYDWDKKPAVPTKVGEKTEGTVKVTYPDGSSTTVPVEVNGTEPSGKETDADKYKPENQPIDVPVGGELPDPSTGIKNKADLPSGTKYDWDKKPAVPTKPGEKTEGTVKVTYPDGSSTTVPVEVNGTEPSGKETDADKYKPESQPIDVPAGGELPDPSTGIKNKDDMPSGTKYDWDKKPAVPTKVGEKTEGTVKVTYPDGSSTTVPVEVNGTEPSDKETDADKYKPETQPIDVPAGGQLPDASSAIKNKDDLPSGTTIDWDKKPAVPTKPGEKTEGTVKVTYPDGSSTTVPVEVNGTEPSGKETDADKYKPETQPIDVPAGGQLPDPSTGIKNKDDLPSGTTIDWDKKPAVPTKPGEKTEGTIKVTYPDGSSTTVPVEVNGTEPSEKETDADKYKPETQPIDVPAGGQLPDASSAIKNKNDMPNGTKYVWKVKPDLSLTGNHSGVITVEFPDGSSVDIKVKVNVDTEKFGKKEIVENQNNDNLHVVNGIKKFESSNTNTAKATTVTENKAAQAKKILPQTGSRSEETAGILGLAIAAIGSLLGLGVNRKKRQK